LRYFAARRSARLSQALAPKSFGHGGVIHYPADANEPTSQQVHVLN